MADKFYHAVLFVFYSLLNCIATIKLLLCHSLVLYIFIQQEIQHPEYFGIRFVLYSALIAVVKKFTAIILLIHPHNNFLQVQD
jgi:hypothetical protein